MKNFFKIIFLISIVSVIIFFIDFKLLIKILKNIDLRIIYLILALTIAYLFVESLIFKKIVSTQKLYINKKVSFFLTSQTYLFNMIFPLTGMTWRAIYLKKNFNFSYNNYLKFVLQFLILEIGISFFILLLLYQIFYLEYLDTSIIYLINLSIFVFFSILAKRVYKKTFQNQKFFETMFLVLILILIYFLLFYSIFLSLNLNLILESLLLSLILGISNYVSIAPGTYGIFEGVAIFFSYFIDILKEEALIIALITRISFLCIVSFVYLFNFKKKLL